MGAWYSTVPPVVESSPDLSKPSPTLPIPPAPVEMTEDEKAVDAVKDIPLPILLNTVAAKVYDDVHRQLSEIQEKHLAASENLSNTIASKLKTDAKSSKPALCLDEENLLLECLNSSKGSGKGVPAVLSCDILANKYHNCAMKALQSKK